MDLQPIPDLIRPMLASLSPLDPPQGDDWIHELKHDIAYSAASTAPRLPLDGEVPARRMSVALSKVNESLFKLFFGCQLLNKQILSRTNLIYPKLKERGMRKTLWALVILICCLAGCTTIDSRGFDVRSEIHTVTKTKLDPFGYNISGFDAEGYNRTGHDKQGYDRTGYDVAGYDRNGFTKEGYNWAGFNKEGRDRDGYNKEGFNIDGFNRAGYDKNGYNKEGYNKEGWTGLGIHKDTKGKFDKEGFDVAGYNKEGYDRNGYDKQGYDKLGYDKDKFNKDGINKLTNTVFDRYGYDRQGFNPQGIHRDTGTLFNKVGINVRGEKGFKVHLTKGESAYTFDIGSIKVDGQPFALYEDVMVSKGRHLIEAETNNYNGYHQAINIRKHTQAIDVSFDREVKITDYGIYP